MAKDADKPAPRGQPVVRAHVDYTLKSGKERLHVLLPDEAEKLQKTPYAVIQVPIFCWIHSSRAGTLQLQVCRNADLHVASLVIRTERAPAEVLRLYISRRIG